MSTFTSFTAKLATKIITLAGVPLPRQKTLDFFGTGVDVTDDPANGRTRVEITAGGGTTDHGALDGLADNDHTQYPLRTGSTLSGTYTWTGGSVVVDVGTVTGTNLRSDSGDPDGSVSGALGDLYRDTDDGALYINTDGATAWSELTPSTAASPSDTAPVAVGGATTIGASELYMRQDARPDIGVKGSNVASAATINLDTATGDYVHVTGTTTITAITLASGIRREVIFDGILTLTHGANLILHTGESATTAAGDLWLFRGEGGGVVRGWKLGQIEAAEVEAAQDSFAFDSTYRGTDDPPGDAGFSIDGDTFLFSAETADCGNQGLAILSRMARGGHVPIERAGAPTEKLELRVGPPTNEVDYLSFPILDRFQTFNAFDVQAVALDRTLVSPNNDQGLHISPDGHHMLTAYAGGDAILQWYLSTPWDPETAVLIHTMDVSALDEIPTDVCWGHDGTYVVWCGDENDLIRVIELTAVWTLSTGTDSGVTLAAPATPLTVRVSDDGTMLYAGNSTNIQRWAWTAGDLTTVVSQENVNVVSALTGLTSISRFDFSPGETHLFVRITDSGVGLYLRKCLLATPGVITGLSTVHQSQDLTSIETSWRGFCMSPDGQYFIFRANTVEQGIVRLINHALTEDVTYRVGFLPGDEASHRDYPLAFEDDATYGHYMEALVDVSWLPDNCIVAGRFHAAVGVAEGDTDDINSAGDYGDMALFVPFVLTKNGGALVRVSNVGFWHPAYESPGTTPGEQFVDVGHSELIGRELTIESGQLRVAVELSGAGAYAGLDLVGTCRVFFDAVTVRGELPAP